MLTYEKIIDYEKYKKIIPFFDKNADELNRHVVKDCMLHETETFFDISYKYNSSIFKFTWNIGNEKSVNIKIFSESKNSKQILENILENN